MENLNETKIVEYEQDSYRKNCLAPSNFQEAFKLAEMLSRSNMIPKTFSGKTGDILAAIQMGNEVGLGPMQSLQNIAVINGKPCLWGDAMLALVQNHPSFEYIKETDDGNTATCIVKRKGGSEHVVKFSMEDAKKAGLLGKPGPWTQYTARMRQMRARGFALRDQFADALKGLSSAEEVRDYNVIDSKPIYKKVDKDEFFESTLDNKISDSEIKDLDKNGFYETISEKQVDEIEQLIKDNELPRDVVLETISNKSKVSSILDVSFEDANNWISYLKNKYDQKGEQNA